MSFRFKGFLLSGFLGVVLFLGVRSYYLGLEDSASAKETFSAIEHLEKEGLQDFELSNLEGLPLKGSSFKKPLLLIHFWATWCAPCVGELPSLARFANKFSEKMDVVAISVDENRNEVISFLDSLKVRKAAMEYLMDPGNTLGPSLGTKKLPETYLFDSQRRLIKKISSTQDWGVSSVQEYFESKIQEMKQGGTN